MKPRIRAEYDFSGARRGTVIPTAGKTRTTVFLDDAILAELRSRAERAGTGYSAMIEEALRRYLAETSSPISLTDFDRVRALRDEDILLTAEHPEVGPEHVVRAVVRQGLRPVPSKPET